MKERDPEYAEHFRNALSNYAGVLRSGDKFSAKAPFDPSAPVPDNWEEDPLILLGDYLELLNLTEAEVRTQRKSFREMVAEQGAEWVWQNRLRLAAEMDFVRDFFGEL